MYPITKLIITTPLLEETPATWYLESPSADAIVRLARTHAGSIDFRHSILIILSYGQEILIKGIANAAMQKIIDIYNERGFSAKKVV